MAYQEFVGSLDGEQPNAFKEFNGELDVETGVLDKVKNASSAALEVISKGIASDSSGSVMDNAPKSGGGTMTAARSGIRFDGNGLSTVSSRAMDIGVDRAITPKGGETPDTMAETARFMQGSRSPRIADQEAVTRKPEVVMADSAEGTVQQYGKKFGESRTLADAYADTYTDLGKDLMSGLAGISSAVGQAEKIAGLEKLGQALVDDGESAQKYWSSLKSDYAKDAAERKFIGHGDFSSFGNAINTLAKGDWSIGDANATTVAGAAIQSAPGMVVMGGVGKLASAGLIKAGALDWATRLLARSGAPLPIAEKVVNYVADGVAFGGAEGVFSGLQNAAQTGTEIRGMSIDKLKQSPVFAQHLAAQDAKLPEEERMKRARSAVADDAEALILQRTIMTTGGISALTGGGVFGVLNRGNGTALGRAVTGIANEGLLQEFPQSGIEQYWQNMGKKLADPSQDLSEGVAEQAVQGGVVGAVMGVAGGGGVANSPPSDAQEVPHPNAKPGSLSSAANIAAKQGITFPSVPAGAIDSASILGVPDTAAVDSTQPTLARAAQVSGTSKPASPSMSILDGANNGTTTEAGTPVLDNVGSADRAGGSSTDAVGSSVQRGDTGSTAAGTQEGGAVLDGGTNAGAIARHVGKSSEVVLPDNTALPAQWEVVDADQVTATLKEGKNQPRDRSRAAANAQVQGIANAPDYRRLSDSPVMDVGAPTLSHDGAIVGGNGRFEGVSRAYDNGTAAEYLARLKDDAVAKGIDPAVIDTMKKPVLVRRMTQPFDTRALAVASNSGGSLQYSALEQAKIDGERMKGLGDVELTDNGDIVMSAANMANVRRALGGYTSAELGSLTDKDGLLSQEGIRRLKNAMLYKAYGNSPVLSRLVESADNDLRAVSSALVRAAGAVASVRSDMAEGNKEAAADIAKDLISAVELLSKIKSSGTGVDQYLSQHALFGKEYTEEAATILRFLAENIRSPKRMAEFIRSYYDELAKENHLTGGLFEAAPVSNKERLDHAAKQSRETDQGTADSGGAAAPALVHAQDQHSAGNAQGIAESGGASQQDTGVNYSQWWTSLSKAERESAISNAGLAIKPVAAWNFISNPHKQAILAARAESANPAGENEGKAKAQADMEDALSEMGAIWRDLASVQRMMPEQKQKLMPVLVKMFDAAFRLGYYEMKDAARYVRDQLAKLDTKLGKFLSNDIMDEAAKKAAEAMPEGFFENQGLFGQAEQKGSESISGGKFIVLGNDMPLFHGTRAGNKFTTFDVTGSKNTGVGSNIFNQGNYAYLTQSREAAQWFADKAAENDELRNGKTPSNQAGDVLEFSLKKGAKLLHMESMPQRDRASALIERAKNDGVDAIMFRDPAFDVVEGSPRVAGMLNSGKPMDTVLVLNHGKLIAEVLGLAAKNKPDSEREHVQDRMTNADKKSDSRNFKLPSLHEFVPTDVLQRAHDLIAKAPKVKPTAISAEDRAAAESALRPLLAKAEKNKPEFDRMVVEIASEVGIGEVLAEVKGIGRAAEKLHLENRSAPDLFGKWIYETEKMRDLLRATIVVKSVDDVQAAIKAIREKFTLDSDVKGERLKDRFKKPDALGYRDILINVKLKDGTVAEIQINIPEMLAAKDFGHELYKHSRALRKGDPLKAELDDAQKALYAAAFANGPKKYSSDTESKYEIGSSSIGQSDGPSSSLNQSSPILQKESPPSDSKNSVPSGNLSGNFISGSSKRTIAKNASEVHNDVAGSVENATQGAQHGNRATGAGSTQTQGAATAGGAAVQRKSGGVREGEGGRNILANDLPGAPDSGRAGNERSDGHGANGDLQRGAAPGKGGRAGRATGIPAGRDIPAKSGLNYRFTDSDLDYKGSWLTKAAQNIAAIELVKRLESEGRKATREEQAIMAKFIGWGASEIRNKIFDPQIDRIERAVKTHGDALAWLKENKKEVMGRYDYGSPYYTVTQMLNAAGHPVPYGHEVSKPMLENLLKDKEQIKWLELRNRLKDLLTEDEWATAERSTQYAHYTGKEVVNEMWRAVERMGFKGGAVLEPGAGNGVFPGLMPSAITNNSTYTGIEYDALTGAILKHLQPDERILVESFIDSALPDNFYDMAIGNPPFSDAKVLSDPRYKKNHFALHNYFFAKTMDKVKPGGLVMFVTSRYTMDGSSAIREYLSDKADLLGAVRLPETAFKKNAGTEVVTDILFLRKKVSGETFEGHEWVGTEKIKVKGGTHLINEYFAKHPEMVLGENAIDRNGMYAENQYTVLPNKSVPITELLDKAVDSLPKDVYRPTAGTAAQAAQVREIDWNPKAKKEGNYYVSDDGRLMQVENRSGTPADKIKPKDLPMVKDFVKLRDAINQAQYDQLNDGDWESSLKALQKEYRAFVKKHGHILQNTVTERKTSEIDEESGEKIEVITPSRRFDLINKLADDPEHAKLFALESINDDTGEIKEGEFLHKRVLEMRKEASISTPHDALLSVLNDVGLVDMPMVAQRIGLSEPEVIEALGSSVYELPNGQWVMQDEYLSGNVKKKLKDAQEAAKSDKRFERNVEALLHAQPAPVSPADITTSLGMNWIPTEVYEQFLLEKTGVKANVAYNEHTGQWRVDAIAGYGTVQATSDWGTPQRNAADILEAGLTGRPIRITRTEGSGQSKKTVFDAAATEAANQKLKEMRQAFKGWMWQDTERTDKLVALYNDKFNTIVARSFDGRHLTLPGTTSTIKVFDHVKRGAWRIIQTGNTYLAHAVGSGKTWEMVISAMEQKRLGLISKPMIVVPNHMLQQFAQEWLQLYPAARLMVADEKQFHTDNRRRFVARAAMSDLDGIIITHSAFKLLDIDPEFKQKMIQEQLDYMEAALSEVQDEEGEKPGSKSRSPRVREIQNRIEKLEEKLKASMSGEGKDKSVRFDEMGVDMLYVDEAHEYRKLEFTTTRQVKGISSTGSERAFDLYMKTRWLEEKHPGRSLVMASGTPITNTIAEIYSVQRFMAPQVLEERGLQDFDSWASMFGEEHTAIEADASGKYAPVTRFSKFVNVPELTQMFREFADVLTSDHLAEMLGDKRPKVKNGSRNLVVTPQVDDYLSYKKVLEARLKKSKEWKPSRDEPNNPDPIIRIIGDGRLAAIDMRFIDPSLPSDPNSKLNQMIDGVIRSHRKYSSFEYNDKTGKLEEHKGATQMVFSDLGFGAGVAEHRGFNARAWMEKRLRDAGIPMSKVAFMSDYKKSDAKQKLFKDVNAGRVLILVGSSKNMGTGVNAQQRLRVLHHLDTPWYPADLEQREGRIIRQGNKNRRVRLYAYSTKDSYDSVMWQMLASKQRFINQALSGDSSVRTLDDISEVSQFEMATAMTAGDPRAIQLAGVKADIEKYQRLYRAHEENRMRMKESYMLAGNTITVSERMLPEAEKLADKVQDLSGDKFTGKVGGRVFDTRKEWGEALLAKVGQYEATAKEGAEKVGELSGFPIEIIGTIDKDSKGNVLGYTVRLVMRVGEDGVVLARDKGDDPVGLAIRAANALAAVQRKPGELRQAIADAKSKRNALEDRLDAPFQFAGEMSSKIKEAAELEAAMVADSKDKADSELVQKAKAFADKYHGEIDQRRKFTNEPYITHPAGVVEILKTVPHTEEMLAAAWAHDTVEDTKATIEDVRRELGDKVADLVIEVTDVRKHGNLSQEERAAAKREHSSKASAAAQTIKLADIIHNLSGIAQADEAFAKRYLAEKAAQIEVLTKGDAKLLEMARDVVDGNGQAGTKYSQSATPVKNPFTLSGLKAAINSAFTHAKDFAGLLEATGKVQFISRDEIGKYLDGTEAFSKAQDQTATPEFKRDVPSQSWLQEQINHAVARGKNKYGVPYMGKITGDFTGNVQVSVDLLASLPGERGEQDNVREQDLAAITKIMRETGKLPIENGKEYAPYIEVAHDGSAWVSEGNHRILAAKALGWETMPVEIRYFDGGEMTAGELSPEKLLNPANPDIRYSADGSRILAFVKDGQTYFVYDNISQADDNVKGLAMHEIALHALQLGRTDAEFQKILKHIETLRRMGNKQVQAARNRVPKDTNEALVLEETAGYLIEGNPDLPIVQKLIARFRTLLRMVGNKLPMVQRMQWFKWANNLTVEDIVLLAQDTMRTAPEALKTAGARGTFKAQQSRNSYPLVSGKSSLEGDIAAAANKLSASIANGATSDVEIGRTPHVLSMFIDHPLTMVMDVAVQKKAFLEKHGSEMEGVTPSMLMQAIYRPAMIFKTGENTFNIATNILTKHGAVLVAIKANGIHNGKRVAMVTTAFPKERGAFADWIKNGKDSEGTSRTLVYADELQLPEAITGRLNPENTNPAFMGRDFVSAQGEINTVEPSARAATSPNSDRLNIAKQGTPVNINYRGMATVSTKLQQYLTGKGESKVKTRKDLQAWIDKHYRGEEDNKPLFSRAPSQPSQENQQPRILRMAKKASMEADTSLIDKVASIPFKLVGWNRIVEPALDRLLERAGEFMPEKVKAGLVSDYGLSGEYIDRKAEMKAAEAAQNRKTAGLVEMLAALTRAESRVAYQWMQERPNTATEQALLERLPAESRETLARLKKMISDMGAEAVRLGQMSQEAYQRNNMAYLHRTYAKHVLDNQGVIGKMLRASALKIKGNQYKGRGIFDEVRMDAVGGEGIFGRKLQQGQADKSLVGDMLIRFERRDDSTDAMDALPGMTKKPMGKLREVVYWPASQPVPAKYGDWVNAGTFEVRGANGDKLVVWRDFTKEERERMGELDEVRYAVAQTLQMMTHDIEVGRFFAWTAKTYGKAKPEGREVKASESMLHSFGKDEWAQVPATNIPGTQTKKYGALAGLYVPGVIWNDIRQTAGARIEPFGHAHEKALQFWKKAKTAWSPAVHMNNVMANFVIADWHDLHASDLAEALKVWAYNKQDGYREIYQRFEDSGALGGMFLSNEALRDEIAKQLESMKAELTGELEAQGEAGRMAKVLHLVTMAGMVPVKGAKLYTGKMEDAYQFEDAIFRLAAFTKAIRYGKSDIEAGRIARHAFLNYDINAPWIQAARHTFLPFVSFFYRALPMAVNTAKSKPWKIVKLMAFYQLVSMLGSMMAGGDDDEERKLLPKEKQGRVWGIVPKMVRMPWNHDDGAPYYLDIRRWVPVGDIADIEMGSGMLPPWATPSGVLILLAEVLLMNKSMFTEKEIVQDTDTQTEKLEKRLDHLFKGMMPNVPLPNPINVQLPAGEINPLKLDQGSLQPYAWSGVERSALKREGSIGEVRTTPAAIASAFGIKVSAYPAQNMMASKQIELRKKVGEIKDEIRKIQRNYGNLENPTMAEQSRFERDIERQRGKLEELTAEQ